MDFYPLSVLVLQPAAATAIKIAELVSIALSIAILAPVVTGAGVVVVVDVVTVVNGFDGS